MHSPAMQTAPVVRHTGSGGGNKKGTSAERRASHNAIERARRESLNGRFLQLAATLPAISDVQRPSKSLIVNKSLDFVKDALNREAMYRLKIDNMHQENMRLREQLNTFLAQAGMDPVPMPSMDELPPPMADAGARKRINHMSMSLPDAYDYDDEDSTFAAGSEGEAGKQSPTSSSSAGSVRGSLSNPANAFTPISNNQHYGMASSGTVTSRPDFEKWMPSHFDASSAPASTASHPSSYTYANLVFPSPGMAPSGSVSQASTAGFEHYMANTPLSMPDATAQTPSHQLAGNYAALRTMQQHQQQQQQMQYNSQQQQQQQAAALNQFNYDALHQPQHFFDHAALQSTSFLTAV